MATPTEVTLLDLVWAVGQYTTSEVEVVATVTSLVNTGQVLLCGNFAGVTINLPVPTFTAPQACMSHVLPAKRQEETMT